MVIASGRTRRENAAHLSVTAASLPLRTPRVRFRQESPSRGAGAPARRRWSLSSLPGGQLRAWARSASPPGPLDRSGRSWASGRCGAQRRVCSGWCPPGRLSASCRGSGKSRLGRAPPGGAGAAHPAGFGRGPARGAREHRASIADASGTTADEPQTPEAPRVLSPGVVAALSPPATCPLLCGAPSLQLPKKPRNPPAQWGGGDGDGAGHEARIVTIRTRGRGSRATARRAGGDQDSSRASFLFPFGSAFCLFPLPPGLTQGHAPSFSPHTVTAPCCGHVRTLRPCVPALRGPALSHILATSLQLPPFKDTIPLIIPRATPTPSPGGLT